MKPNDSHIYDNDDVTTQNVQVASSHSSTAFRYTGLFVFYVVSAYLFSFLNAQNHGGSLWPSAGIALAGCLLWQYRFLFAIMTGSFIVIIYSHATNINDIELFVVLLSISLGAISALQAWLNYRLITYFSLDITNTPCLRKVSLFITLALFSCLIGSLSSNMLIDVLLNDGQGPSYWADMTIWWLCNFLGVITITPIILICFKPNCRFTQTLTHSQALIYPLFLLVVTLAASQIYTNNLIEKDSINRLQTHSELFEKALSRQVNDYLNSLASLALNLSGNNAITQKEFEELALPLIAKTKGIKAFSWNPVIEQHLQSSFEKHVNNQISTLFKVRGGPLRQEDPLVVVKWIEPFASNLKAFGFNVFSNAARREAMIRAQNTNSPVATEIIQLVQLDTKKPGFLIFTPVNRGLSLSSETLFRSFHLDGFAVGVFEVSDIVLTSLKATNTSYMNVKILDMSSNSDVIYHYSPANYKQSISDDFEFSFIQNVAGRSWKLVLTVSPDAINALKTEDAVTFLIYESAIGALCILLIITLFSNHKLLLDLVKQRTEKLEKSRDLLKQYAFTDPLTNLPNRRMFLEQANQSLDLATQENHLVAILFLDLNGFKNVNDILGHDFGDQLLTKVAESFRGNLRSRDILARYGGDEFIILLEDLTNKEDAITVSKKLINGLQKPFEINNESFCTSTSIGIATFPEDGKTINELLRAADMAMYEAKESSSGYFNYANLNKITT